MLCPKTNKSNIVLVSEGYVRGSNVSRTNARIFQISSASGDEATQQQLLGKVPLKS